MGSHRCGVFLRRKGSESLSLYLFILPSLLGLDIHEKGHQVCLFFYPFYTPLWKQVWVGAGIGIAKKRRWEEALPVSRGSIPPWNHFFWSQWNISCSGSQWEKHALRLRPRWLSAPLEMLIASITFAWDQILLTSVVAWLLGIWLVWESQCHV